MAYLKRSNEVKANFLGVCWGRPAELSANGYKAYGKLPTSEQIQYMRYSPNKKKKLSGSALKQRFTNYMGSHWESLAEVIILIKKVDYGSDAILSPGTQAFFLPPLTHTQRFVCMTTCARNPSHGERCMYVRRGNRLRVRA